MPPIGPVSIGAIPDLQWQDGSPFSILPPHQVPKWPNPNSGRIDGRLRWLSDENVFPLASRYVALMKCRTEGLSPNEFRSQWFWFDLNWVGPGLIFVGESGQDADISFTFEIGFVDVLPNAGVPGTYLKITLHVDGETDGEQYTEVPYSSNSWPFNVDWNYLIGKTTIPSTWPFGYSTPWSLRECDWYPVSECCPCSDLTTSGGDTMLQAALMFKDPTPTVNVNSTATIFFENVAYDSDGFINLGADNTKIVVPSGYNWMKLNAGIELSANGNACSFFMTKNGAYFDGFPASGASSGGGFSGQLNLATGWIPVVPGDYFQVRAQGTGRTTGPDGQATWFSCEARA